MTEREIQILGFEKQESVDYPKFCYYTYRVCRGLEFISCIDQEVVDGEWYVDIFNTEIPIRFYKMEKVQSLINTFENAKVKKN